MPPGEAGMGSRPLLSIDIDGVLARPPLGRVFNMRRDLDLEPAPVAGVQARGEAPPTLADRLLMATYYRVRYAGRGPMPGALEMVEAAGVGYRLVALSGRNWRGRAATEAWLRRYGLRAAFEAVRLNDTGLSSARFKRWAVERLGAVRHVDDDPATAALVARAGVPVDLVDWPGNRGLAYPPGVTRHAGLLALAEALRGVSTRGAEAAR